MLKNILKVIFVITIFFLTACERCSQSGYYPEYITTSSNPWTRIIYTTNTDLEQIRWENVTSGASAYGNIYRGSFCTLIGCFPVKMEYIVDLIPGENHVFLYEKDYDSVCEWKEEFFITFQ